MGSDETRDRLLQSFEFEKENVAALMARVDGDDDHDADEAREELDNMILSLDERRTVDVLLGFGGPNIWVAVDMVKTDYGWAGDKATWHGAWGGEHVTRNLSDDEPLARWAMGEAELLMEHEQMGGAR